MTLVRIPGTLETDRLILRQPGVADAAVYRQLWTERDQRVPQYRLIDSDGRPTVEDIAAQIRAEGESPGAGLLTVERKGECDVIGYCGLTAHGNGSPEEPELAYELLRAAQGSGYATEAARAVVTWAGEAGYRRLWAGVWDWNVPSRRVLEKLRFREVGRAEPISVDGHTVLTVLDLQPASTSITGRSSRRSSRWRKRLDARIRVASRRPN